MIKPVGYAYIGDLSRIEEGVFDTIAITSSYDAGGCTVPLFTLDQVRELVGEGYRNGFADAAVTGEYAWKKSEAKRQLDAIAAQAAGGEV